MTPLSRIDSVAMPDWPPQAMAPQAVAPDSDFEATLAQAETAQAPDAAAPAAAPVAAPSAPAEALAAPLLNLAPTPDDHVLHLEAMFERAPVEATSEIVVEAAASETTNLPEPRETVDLELDAVEVVDPAEVPMRAPEPVEVRPETVAMAEVRAELAEAPPPKEATPASPSPEAAEELVEQIATDLKPVVADDAAPVEGEVAAQAVDADHLRVELGQGESRMVIDVRTQGTEVALTAQASESVAAAMLAGRPLLDAALGKYGLKLKSFDWERRRPGGEAQGGQTVGNTRRIRVRRWQLLA